MDEEKREVHELDKLSPVDSRKAALAVALMLSASGGAMVLSAPASALVSSRKVALRPLIDEAYAKHVPPSSIDKGGTARIITVYGQNFANYGMNFANYGMNFANYGMNFSNYGQDFKNPSIPVRRSGLSIEPQREVSSQSLPNGLPIPQSAQSIIKG